MHATYNETVSRADIFEKVNRDIPIENWDGFSTTAKRDSANLERIKKLAVGSPFRIECRCKEHTSSAATD